MQDGNSNQNNVEPAEVVNGYVNDNSD
jgi:hypothetical protein